MLGSVNTITCDNICGPRRLTEQSTFLLRMSWRFESSRGQCIMKFIQRINTRKGSSSWEMYLSISESWSLDNTLSFNWNPNICRDLWSYSWNFNFSQSYLKLYE